MRVAKFCWALVLCRRRFCLIRSWCSTASGKILLGVADFWLGWSFIFSLLIRPLSVVIGRPCLRPCDDGWGFGLGGGQRDFPGRRGGGAPRRKKAPVEDRPPAPRRCVDPMVAREPPKIVVGQGSVACSLCPLHSWDSLHLSLNLPRSILPCGN